MANVHFLRKMAQDDLWDTIFFASGEVPIKEKTKDFVQLKTRPFEIKIYTNRKILINGFRCNAVKDAKSFIQHQIKNTL